MPLAGGWRKGDRVLYLIDYDPQGLKKGDVGTVLGPCNNQSLDNVADRVLVDFGSKGRVNACGKTHLESAKTLEHICSEAEAPRAKRWGAGLEAPAAGSRNFAPHGFVVTLDVQEAIARFGHSASHVAQIMDAGRAKASTSDTPIAVEHAAALYAYTEETPLSLYGTLNYTMGTPHTSSTPTDTALKRYVDYIVHMERALSSLPTHVSEVHGMVYRGIRTLLNSNVYAVGKQITWQAFSSSTKRQNVTLSFLNMLPGRTLQGSLFLIKSIIGKDVHHFSASPSEQEVIFPPNSQFKVEKVLTSEQEKKSMLSELAAYHMVELDVYVLKQIA